LRGNLLQFNFQFTEFLYIMQICVQVTLGPWGTEYLYIRLLTLDQLLLFKEIHKVQKGKAIPVTSRGGPYIFYKIGSQMEVRLSALCAGHILPPMKIPGTHFY
jgi:hypothetical protein